MPVQDVKAQRLSWGQITLLLCGFWLLDLVGNTRNPLANFFAVSVYDVRSVAMSPHLVMQLLAGPLAGALGCVVLVTVIGGRWGRTLLQPIPLHRWWWLVPLSVVLCALRLGLTITADQLPWTWLEGAEIADIQWEDLGLIGVVALRELFTLIATWVILLTLDSAFNERLRSAWRWPLYLLLGFVAAGLATTSASPNFVRNLLVAGVPAIAGLLVFRRFPNIWFVVLSYELGWRVATVALVLATW